MWDVELLLPVSCLQTIADYIDQSIALAGLEDTAL